MYSRVQSAVYQGYECRSVQIETHISGGLPHYAIVGLPSAVIKESKERVRSALKSSGVHYPDEHITQNLFPACERKEGSQLDLPLAAGIFCAMHQISPGGAVFLGELSLDGQIHAISHLSTFLLAYDPQTTFVLPEGNREEFSGFGLKHDRCYFYSHLSELFQDLRSGKFEGAMGEAGISRAFLQESSAERGDFSDLLGQDAAVRAAQIAAVGSFHTILYGPPGCGKTMIANRLSGILPCPSRQEMMEISKVYGNSMLGRRPVRAPHHSVTKSGLIGGGNFIQIGEISKAHGGVLILDEFGEFKKDVLETLREPLESGQIHLSRHKTSAILPARFMLVATMNPCFCGRYDPQNPIDCTCEYAMLKKYYAKLSWPLIDRMGIFIRMEHPDPLARPNRSSQALRAVVESAVRFSEKHRSDERFSGEFSASLHALLANRQITLRSMEMIMKVAIAIADLEHSPIVRTDHLEEAVSLNPAIALGKILD